MVPRTDFGRNFAKTGPPRPNLAAKISLGGPVLAAKSGPPLPKMVPHSN